MSDAAWPQGFAVSEDARAKINLALHVMGQRPDGYHLLDMLVTFTREGDRLGFRLSEADTFTISGKFASSLRKDGGTNLVVRARDGLRDLLASTSQDAPAVHIHLEKNLPIASGIGGGSADAAAALRGLSRVWNAAIADDTLAGIALRLGADVPMCLKSRPLVARGVGEDISVVEDMPSFPVVIGNPLIAVSTPEVFRILARKDNPALETACLSGSRADWLSGLRDLRNDLQAPAQSLCPAIGELLEMIADEGADLVRMSGSGASCYGIFMDPTAAHAAAARLHERRPDWYFRATETVSGVMR